MSTATLQDHPTATVDVLATPRPDPHEQVCSLATAPIPAMGTE